MKRKIAEIRNHKHGFPQSGQEFSCEPSLQEIQLALDSLSRIWFEFEPKQRGGKQRQADTLFQRTENQSAN
jgi:hypothetical protein